MERQQEIPAVGASLRPSLLLIPAVLLVGLVVALLPANKAEASSWWFIGMEEGDYWCQSDPVEGDHASYGVIVYWPEMYDDVDLYIRDPDGRPVAAGVRGAGFIVEEAYVVHPSEGDYEVCTHIYDVSSLDESGDLGPQHMSSYQSGPWGLVWNPVPGCSLPLG